MILVSKTMIVREIKESEHEEWDCFVEQSPEGTVYHTSTWLMILRQIADIKTSILGCFDSGELVGGCVFGVKQSRFYRIAYKPWATAYTGIIFSGVISVRKEEIVQKLVGTLTHRFHYVRLVHAPAFRATVLLEERGWRIAPNYTYLLDVRSVDLLWHNFDRRVRQRVRKAEKNGISVEQSGDATTFHQLYRMTYQRQHLPFILPERVITALCHLLQQQKIGELFIARNRGGEACAGLITVWDKKRAYFMLAASHPQLRKTDAASLLWWEVLRSYALRFREVDLVGEGTPGIARFKRSFRPDPVVFYETSRFSSPLRQLEYDIFCEWKKIKQSFSKYRKV